MRKTIELLVRQQSSAGTVSINPLAIGCSRTCAEVICDPVLDFILGGNK